MNSYNIRTVTEEDIESIIRVYNSNEKFLRNYLGVTYIDKDFVIKEMAEMKAVNFISSVVVDVNTDTVVGVLDYKPDSSVYLSLMMIDSKFQGNCVGTIVYNLFEASMRKQGKSLIRIDVVNDYEENVVGFWKKQGFTPKNEIKLSWNNKQSSAIIMLKALT